MFGCGEEEEMEKKTGAWKSEEDKDATNPITPFSFDKLLKAIVFICTQKINPNSSHLPKHSLKNSNLLSCQGVMDAYRKKESNYGRLGCSSWTHDESKHS